jgi:hypothetical protein
MRAAATSGRRMKMPETIQFTTEEKQQLAKAITKAACGIAECWDVLSEISTRINKDWEPVDTSVSDIADHNAACIDNPAAIEPLDADAIAEYFEDVENWSN